MNAIQSIMKNTMILFVAQALTAILSYFFLVLVARYLGPVEFGSFSFAIAFTSMLVIFADMGLSNLIIREIAIKKPLINDYISNTLLMKTLFSIPTLLLIYLLVKWMNYSYETIYIVVLFGFYSIIASFMQSFKSLFRAFEKISYESIITVFERLISFILGLGTLLLGYGLSGLAYSYIFAGIISTLLSALLSLSIIKRITKPKFVYDFVLCKYLFIAAIPFCLNIIFSVIFFKIDTIMLSILKSDIEVGYYNAAYTPLLALSIIPMSFTATLYPLMSRIYVLSTSNFYMLLEKSYKYLFLIGFPISLIAFTLADKIILFMYGLAYAQSIEAFQILALFVSIRFINDSLGVALTSTNKQKYRTLAVMLSSIVNILINLILIPPYGIIGASIATVLSELILFILFIYFTHHPMKSYFFMSLIKPIFCGMLTALFTIYFGHISLIILVILSSIFYVFALVVFKTFDRDDLDIFNNILKKNKSDEYKYE